MLNSSTRLFFFQFSSIDGLDSMLKNGPWFIPNNLLIVKKWNMDVNLLKEDVVNVLVWFKLHGVLVTAFSADSLSTVATKLGIPSIIVPLLLNLVFLRLLTLIHLICASNHGVDQAMLEQRLSFRLCGVERYYVGEIPKLAGERLYTRNICVEYEWKPLKCACCKVFGHVQDECPKKIGSVVAKNLKNPGQATRYVPKVVKYRKEVSNLNPFDVLNSVENNVDLGKNGRTLNLASKEINFSGYSLWNVGSSSISTIPIGKPMETVDYSGDHDSEDEVEPFDNGMASFMVSERVDYGTNSL
ncbi:putative reverse transcriptase domain-containing protein [Tanacetum coccineum]